MPEEKFLKCAFCPCQFSTEHDFKLHMDTFGEGASHFYKWRKVLRLPHVSYEKWKEARKAENQG